MRAEQAWVLGAVLMVVGAGCGKSESGSGPAVDESGPTTAVENAAGEERPSVARKSLAGHQVIAHRGVAQTYHRKDLTNETCTAERIDAPRHGFIENTLPSLAEAFRLGATMIEIDVHRTADEQIVVFHDWTLDCRTDGTGITRERTLAELRALDVGYGYTADGGETFPLRGKGVGLMPTLQEVLERFPDGRFLLDQKDRDVETARLLGAVVARHSAAQRVYYWGEAAGHEALLSRAPGVRRLMMTAREARRCGKEFLLGDGGLPESCRVAGLPVPIEFWPMASGLVRAARDAGVPAYLLWVNDEDDLDGIDLGLIAGIVTDRVDLWGSPGR